MLQQSNAAGQGHLAATDVSKTLSDLKPSETGVIQRVKGAGAVRRRMLDMGLTAGAEVTVARVAPLGDPIEFVVRGYHLSLRRSEAMNIEVVVAAEGGQPR